MNAREYLKTVSDKNFKIQRGTFDGDLEFDRVFHLQGCVNFFNGNPFFFIPETERVVNFTPKYIFDLEIKVTEI